MTVAGKTSLSFGGLGEEIADSKRFLGPPSSINLPSGFGSGAIRANYPSELPNFPVDEVSRSNKRNSQTEFTLFKGSGTRETEVSADGSVRRQSGTLDFKGAQLKSKQVVKNSLERVAGEDGQLGAPDRDRVLRRSREFARFEGNQDFERETRIRRKTREARGNDEDVVRDGFKLQRKAREQTRTQLKTEGFETQSTRRGDRLRRDRKEFSFESDEVQRKLAVKTRKDSPTRFAEDGDETRRTKVRNRVKIDTERDLKGEVRETTDVLRSDRVRHRERKFEFSGSEDQRRVRVRKRNDQVAREADGDRIRLTQGTRKEKLTRKSELSGQGVERREVITPRGIRNSENEIEFDQSSKLKRRSKGEMASFQLSGQADGILGRGRQRVSRDRGQEVRVDEENGTRKLRSEKFQRRSRSAEFLLSRQGIPRSQSRDKTERELLNQFDGLDLTGRRQVGQVSRDDASRAAQVLTGGIRGGGGGLGRGKARVIGSGDLQSQARANAGAARFRGGPQAGSSRLATLGARGLPQNRRTLGHEAAHVVQQGGSSRTQKARHDAMMATIQNTRKTVASENTGALASRGEARAAAQHIHRGKETRPQSPPTVFGNDSLKGEARTQDPIVKLNTEAPTLAAPQAPAETSSIELEATIAKSDVQEAGNVPEKGVGNTPEIAGGVEQIDRKSAEVKRKLEAREQRAKQDALREASKARQAQASSVGQAEDSPSTGEAKSREAEANKLSKANEAAARKARQARQKLEARAKREAEGKKRQSAEVDRKARAEFRQRAQIEAKRKADDDDDDKVKKTGSKVSGAVKKFGRRFGI